MKTRIYTLVVALLLIAVSANAQSKTATTLSVTVDNADYMTAGDDANVVVTMTPDDFNGIATISVTPEGGSPKPYNVAVVNGAGCYVVNNLAGSYTIQASFAGDDKYAESTSEDISLYVPKITTGLDISLDKTNINVGEKATVSITLNQTGYTNAQGGTTPLETPERLQINEVVSIKVNTYNGEGISVPLRNGQGTYDLIGLEAGTYIIDVVYAGDDKYVSYETKKANKTLTLTVNKTPVTSLSVADISPINAGEDAIVNVTMTPDNINAAAKLVVGEEEYPFGIVNGSGKCLVPNVKASTHNVKAVLDDYKYTGESEVKQLIVNGSDPLFKERNAKVTVKLDTESDAFVTLTVGGNDYYVAVKNGEGTFIAPQFTKGEYNISAALAADDQYVGKTVDNAATIHSVPGISYSFAEGQQWMTWCDEWGWAKPDGIKAYTISGVTDDAITVEELTDGVIPSHTPLLLQKTGDALTPTSVKAAADTGDLVSDAGSGFTYWGNTADAVIDQGNYYTAGKSYVLYKGTFLKASSDNGIAANRCMLTLSSPNATRSLSIGGEGTTGINSVENLEFRDESWYSLDGRKLVGKPAKKGVYVHNGKKEVVK